MRPRFAQTPVSDFTPSGAPSEFDGVHLSRDDRGRDHACIDGRDPTTLVVSELMTRPSFLTKAACLYGLFLSRSTSLALYAILDLLH